METKNILTHWDADGIVSLSLAFQHFYGLPIKAFFTSASRAKEALCSLIAKDSELKELYVFDIGINEITAKLASVYKKVIWIDHHTLQIERAPENIELVVDENSPSAAQVVAKFFSIDSELIPIINEIDTNNVKSENAKFLRDLIAALKLKFKGFQLTKKFLFLAKFLAFKGIEELKEKDELLKILDEYKKLVEERWEKLKEALQVFESKFGKTAILETTHPLPIYVICEKLKSHKEYPFDLIAILIHKANLKTNQISTKIELRTATNKDVFEIAKRFGGGGHKYAAGASVEGYLTKEKLLQVVNEL